MNVVIMGCSRFGATLGSRLSTEGHHVTIIDITSEAFEQYLDPGFQGQTVLGNGIDEDVLREAGIERADAFVSATGGDNDNLMAAQITKVIFGVPRVVARCNDPVRMEIYGQLGLATISPSLLGARALYDAVMNDALHQPPPPAAAAGARETRRERTAGQP